MVAAATWTQDLTVTTHRLQSPPWRDRRSRAILSLLRGKRREVLGSVVSSFPGTPAQGAFNAPLSEWPRDLSSMTSMPTDQAR
jgi:hypothetical protein